MRAWKFRLSARGRCRIARCRRCCCCHGLGRSAGSFQHRTSAQAVCRGAQRRPVLQHPNTYQPASTWSLPHLQCVSLLVLYTEPGTAAWAHHQAGTGNSSRESAKKFDLQSQ
jgi:hypothetical protein